MRRGVYPPCNLRPPLPEAALELRQVQAHGVSAHTVSRVAAAALRRMTVIAVIPSRCPCGGCRRVQVFTQLGHHALRGRARREKHPVFAFVIQQKG